MIKHLDEMVNSSKKNIDLVNNITSSKPEAIDKLTKEADIKIINLQKIIDESNLLIEDSNLLKNKQVMPNQVTSNSVDNSTSSSNNSNDTSKLHSLLQTVISKKNIKDNLINISDKNSNNNKSNKDTITNSNIDNNHNTKNSDLSTDAGSKKKAYLDALMQISKKSN
ncbi:MAG TPA: hypothetical protein QKA14_01115, partial [Candidatus Megaira endosymbiont of Hartmannula sinica]|nr:hypothetical protein [Candidatus Megaera endosymbiont of Hartmannula sinica]